MLSTIRSSLDDTAKVTFDKFSDALISLGITKMIDSLVVAHDSYYSELTLCYGDRIGLQKVCFDTEDSIFTSLDTYLRGKKGYEPYIENRVVDSVKERGFIDLIYSYKGKDILIGSYSKERNLIQLPFYLSPSSFMVPFNGSFLKFLVTLLGYLVKKYKISKCENEELVKKHYVKSIIEKASAFKDTLEKEAKKLRKNIDEDYEDALLQQRKLDVLVDTLRFLDNKNAVLMEKVLDESLAIEELDFVKEVVFTTEGIKVVLDEIHILYEGEKIFMGNYSLLIEPSKVQILNPDAIYYNDVRFEGIHIEDGSVCYGKSKDTYQNLLYSFQYKKLVHFLYTFLSTYNSHDTYVSMENWINARAEGGSYSNYEDDENYEDCEVCANSFHWEDLHQGICRDCQDEREQTEI